MMGGALWRGLLALALDGDGHVGDGAATGRAGGAVATAGTQAGVGRTPTPKVRVIQMEPSFLGKPWIQPRANAKSWSTQMNGQVVTSSPSRSALTTIKNSR